MTRFSSLNRRHFLKRLASATAVAAAFPTIIPASARGAAGTVAPSNRITLATLGTGPRCIDVLKGALKQADAQVVAVCDVKADQRAKGSQLVNEKYGNQDCRTYENFQEVLARKAIDACIIGSPDHWHVIMGLQAVRAGKDIYVEKPMGCSLEEDQLLRKAVQKYRRIFQFGTQQRSDRKFRLACELVRNGRIGKLKHVNVWCPGSTPGGSTQEVPVPAGLDYNAWLGPAPFKPYREHLCDSAGETKTWWFNSDYALGFIAGWGIHPLDIALWGGGDLLNGRVEIEGPARYPTAGACNTATTWDLNLQFASGVTMTFVGVPNGGNNGKATGEAWAHEAEWKERYGKLDTHGTAFEGTDGWIMVNRGRLASNQASLPETPESELPLKLKVSSDHVRDFLDSIKSRQPTVSPVEEAVRGDALCYASDIAGRLARKVTFDLAQEEFVKDRTANKLLDRRTPRKPWKF
jgi:predicted dehydrogenase